MSPPCCAPRCSATQVQPALTHRACCRPLHACTESPEQILDSLPVLLNNLKMVHAISRHYAQLDELARFLQRIAHQLVLRSKQSITAGGKLWDQPKPALLERLAAAERLHAAFMVGPGRAGARPLGEGALRPLLLAVLSSH